MLAGAQVDRRRRLAALWRAGLCCLLAAATFAGEARGDADPASDSLLIQDYFFPYQPAVSAPLQNAVQALLASAQAAKFPVKVAIIASAADLGGLSQLYGQPQQYADFLDREISYNAPVRLLVVMPQGFGTHAVGQRGELNPLLPIRTDSGSSDGLARAAIAGVEKLAADAGHPLPAPKIAAVPAGSKAGGGTSSALTFGAPVALLIVIAAAAAVSRRRADRLDDEEEEEGGDA